MHPALLTYLEPLKAHQTTKVKTKLCNIKEIFVMYSTNNCNGDLTNPLMEMKFAKSTAFVDIYLDFFIHCGVFTKQWLEKFFFEILLTIRISPSTTKDH